jgi:hypothetical protein
MPEEQYIPLAEISKAMPHLPHRHLSSWWRYAEFGLRGVKLKSRWIFGRLCSTAEWVEEFNDAINKAAGKETPRPKTIKQRQREKAHAHKRLTEMGIK